MATIYVYLPEEAVDVWAPVNADHIADDVYRITGKIVVKDNNVYEFGKGDLVLCRTQTLVEGITPGECLVAFERVVEKGGQS